MSLLPKAAPGRALTYVILFLMLLTGVSARAQLRADFTPSKTGDCESLITKFNDNSTGNPVSWQWNLGNGATSTQQSPSASYTTAGTYKVTLIVKDAAGNTSTAEKSVTVWEKPKPDFTASPAKGCIPFDVTFTDKSNPMNGTITAYSWDFGDGATGSGSNPVHTYNNALSPTVTLTVTNSNGCTASKQISNIVDAAAPLVVNFNVSDKFLCTAPGALTVTNTSTGPGNLTYKWDFGDGGTASVANPGPHNYTTRGVYKIKLTVTSDKGCTASKTSEDINVANFKTDFVPPASICANSRNSEPFSAANNPQADNVTWSVDKGYIDSYSSPSVLYYPSGGPGTVKVTMTAEYGKCQESVTKDFVVKPAPQAAFSFGQAAICDVPATVKFTDKSQGATSWNWSFGNEQTSTQQNPSVTYNAVRGYTVKLTVGNASGCTSEAWDYIYVVKPEVNAYASINEGCEGLTPSFSSWITAGDNIVGYEWDFGDGSPKSTAATPSHTYTTAGTYTVKLTYTTANGCKGTVNLYSTAGIRVYKKPVPDFSSPEAPQVCGNNWVHFNGTADVGNEWIWDFGDGTAGVHTKNSAHSYREPGIYTVSLTVANFGCRATVTKTDFIKAVNPFPRFAVQPVNCENRTEMGFDDLSIGNITSWKWSWGDGKENVYTSKTSPAKHKYDKTGAYLVKLTVSDGTCTSTDSLSITVYAPSPIAITTDKTTLCSNEMLKASITSIDPAIPISHYFWHSSDGTFPWDYNSQNATFANLKPGKDTIRFIRYNMLGCADTSNKVPVTVRGPVAKFLAPDVLECRGTELTFTDQTDVSNGKPIKTWSWNFGDGTPAKIFTAPPFKYTYNKSGYFSPTLTVTDEDGCTSMTSGAYLQVNGPNADFMPSASLIPPGGDIWFFNYTSETGGNATYQWDFGDNTSSTEHSPNKIYPDKGVYTVKLLAKDNNGCVDSAKKQIKVSSVSAGFTVTTSFVNNSGCPPVIARFTNTSVNHASSYWDFGDGSFSTIDNPSHTYTYAGKYKVKLKVIGDADTEDEYEEEVEVKGPYATITTSSNGGCLTKEIEFKVEAMNAVNFAWDFTDGNVTETTDAVIKHTFKDPGIYKPRLILSDQAGCKGTAFLKDPIVIDKLDVQLASVPEFVCDEGWITFAPRFNSYSIDELKEEATYKWTYETGLQAENDATATPRFYLDKMQGYNFTLITTTAFGCTQTVSKTVHAYPKPVSAITGPLQACQDAPVSFSGTVSNAGDVAWKWDFGNNNTGNAQQPANQAYSKPGLAEVKLIVTSKDGCSDTALHDINITPTPVVNAAAKTDVVCLGSSATLSAGGGIAYQWSPATDLSNPQAPNPVASPRVNTTYQVTVKDANGCTNTDDVSIRVAQPFRIQATPDTVLCLGHVLPLRVAGADHYLWKGEGLDDTGSPYPHATIKTTGNYTYEVTGYDADGCFTHDTSLVVNVQPAPTVNAGPDRTGMAGIPVTLGARGSADIIQWTWTPPEYLDCTTCPSPVALPNISTNYTVEVKNSYGCKATDEVLVKVTCDMGAVFLPTGFSPNKDGVNERFYPKGRGIKEVAWMRIYDRWGGLVFERTHFQINSAAAGWDGTWKNKAAPYGSYVYAIETVCEDGTTFVFRGTVTLIR